MALTSTFKEVSKTSSTQTHMHARPPARRHTRTHTHTHTPAGTPTCTCMHKHARTNTQTCAHMHARTRARTHTHTPHFLSHLLANVVLMLVKLRVGQIKGGQPKTVADGVTHMGVEEEGHAFRSQIAISILLAIISVDLGISVQVLHPLDVHHNQLVP